jgi:hypothetical protein
MSAEGSLEVQTEMRVTTLLGLITAIAVAQAPALRVTFSPESPQFETAASEYTEIWTREGERIVNAMQSVSGLTFDGNEVRAVVFEGTSNSGYRALPMRLRASYPPDTKKATLIHELGHRLESDLFSGLEDDHQYLFLWLYDVWVKLYGRQFADDQVAVEKARGRMYPAAWDAAMALTAEQRASKWRETVAARK